jgi:hypothetical protein
MGRCFRHPEGILMSASFASFKRPSRRKLAAGVAAVLALSASVSHAATWYVNDCTDDTAAGHFRWAVNGAVSGDTIDLTTQLTPAGYPNCTNAVLNGFNHTLLVGSTVTLAGGVTIQGPGKNELAISALGLNARAILASGNLTINDLGVKYGGGTAPSTGACIRATNDITLSNVRAYHCYSYSNASNARGGAIYSFVGGVTMTGSTVEKSQAASVSGNVRGGAVYGFTSVSITSSSISSSTATTQTGSAGGGAVYNNGSGGGALTISGSYVKGTASVTGAGGHAYGGGAASRTTASLTNNTIVKGVATTVGTLPANDARGGGIYSVGNVDMHDANVWNGNAYSKTGASRGGGVYTKGNNKIYYSSIQANSAQRGGGSYSSAGFVSKYSLIHNNNASNGGGVINHLAGNSLVRGTTFSFNHGYGWALDLFAGGSTSATIENSTFVHNNGTSSNGAAYLKAFHVTLDNSTVAYNNSAGSSAAVFVVAGNAGSTFDLHSTLLASNTNGSGRSDLYSAGASIPFTASSSNNFVRDPGGGVPADTIVGQCPMLREHYSNGGWAYFMQRPSSKSPVIDVGSNPLGLSADQRGGTWFAAFPPRASGPGPANASPIPDIGSYEVNQDDIIFDSEFESCL